MRLIEELVKYEKREIASHWLHLAKRFQKVCWMRVYKITGIEKWNKQLRKESQ